MRHCRFINDTKTPGSDTSRFINDKKMRELRICRFVFVGAGRELWVDDAHDSADEMVSVDEVGCTDSDGDVHMLGLQWIRSAILMGMSE